MSIFRRKHHKSKDVEAPQPEVVSEVPDEVVQLQNLIRKRKISSRSKNLGSKQNESEPDFKESLYRVVEKRKKRLAKKNKVQTSMVDTNELKNDVVSEESINVEEIKENIVKPKKPRKKKTETISNSISEVSTPSSQDNSADELKDSIE